MGEREQYAEHQRWEDEKLKAELKDAGFKEVDAEPGNCDCCSKVDSLYFGSDSYFDHREGNVWCMECALKAVSHE